MNTEFQKRRLVSFIEACLFNVKWLLIPFYFGLVAVLFYYGLAYAKEIIEFLSHGHAATIDEAKLFALETVDVVMIANLIKMIITGSYNSFVSKAHGHPNENISSGELKIKITTSVVVLALINLLREFVANTTDWESIKHQLFIFGTFLVAAVVLSVVELIHVKSEVKH